MGSGTCLLWISQCIWNDNRRTVDKRIELFGSDTGLVSQCLGLCDQLEGCYDVSEITRG